MKISKGFTAIEGLLILLIVGILGGIGYYVWNSHQKTATPAKTTSSTTTQSTIPNGYKEYKNTQNDYSFIYPSDWTLNTDDADSLRLKSPDYKILDGGIGEATGAGAAIGIYVQDLDKFNNSDQSTQKILDGTYNKEAPSETYEKVKAVSISGIAGVEYQVIPYEGSRQFGSQVEKGNKQYLIRIDELVTPDASFEKAAQYNHLDVYRKIVESFKLGG